METSKQPACIVRWVVRLCWGNATRISQREKTHLDNTVVKKYNKQTNKLLFFWCFFLKGRTLPLVRFGFRLSLLALSRSAGKVQAKCANDHTPPCLNDVQGGAMICRCDCGLTLKRTRPCSRSAISIKPFSTTAIQHDTLHRLGYLTVRVGIVSVDRDG